MFNHTYILSDLNRIHWCFLVWYFAGNNLVLFALVFCWYLPLLSPSTRLHFFIIVTIFFFIEKLRLRLHVFNLKIEILCNNTDHSAFSTEFHLWDCKRNFIRIYSFILLVWLPCFMYTQPMAHPQVSNISSWWTLNNFNTSATKPSSLFLAFLE